MSTPGVTGGRKDQRKRKKNHPDDPLSTPEFGGRRVEVRLRKPGRGIAAEAVIRIGGDVDLWSWTMSHPRRKERRQIEIAIPSLRVAVRWLGRSQRPLIPQGREHGTLQEKDRRSRTEVRELFGGFHPSKIRPDPSSKKFEKAAEEPEGSGDGSYSYETEEEREKAPLFPKPALTPDLPVDPPPKLALRAEQTPRGGSTFGGADAKEKAALDSFDIKALEIFLELQERGLEMEIETILKELKDDGEWTEAFVSLVRPKRAATGLRYARLVENMITWIKRKEQRTGEQAKDILDREAVWIYLHDLSMKGIGKYTPKGVVNAIRYFGEAFGVDSSAVLCRRVRKLTDSYCKQTRPKSQAPMLTVKTLELLEGTVVNPAIQKGIRIAAGKLRLCVQASLRWDDLARTPLANVEWVRRKGCERIAGLRSRFGDSKTGPRPWVSSYLGVTPRG